MPKPVDRLALLTSNAPPTVSDVVQDVASGALFGPFAVGSQVRVSVAIGNVWVVFGGRSVTVAARAAGDPLVAGDRVDYEIQREGERYCYVICDTDSAEGWASVREVAQLKGC